MTRRWAHQLAREFSREDLFDEGVEAARNACVAGASIAAAAITAAAFYAGPLLGLPALRGCMKRIRRLPLDEEAWARALRPSPHPDTLDEAFVPGFGYVGPPQAIAVLDACRRWAESGPGRHHSRFFLRHRQALCAVAGPLNQVGLAALAFVDRGVSLDRAERWFLLWRLRPALAEAQRARRLGVKTYPFLSKQYHYEGARPPVRSFNLARLMQQLGLEEHET